MTDWTMKETLKDKTLYVLILTVILTIALNILLNQLLTQEVAVEGSLYSSRTVHFSLGIHGIILAIPAGIISILILKFYLNRKEPKYGPSDNEANFKWYSIYGTVCGFLALTIMYGVTKNYTAQIEPSNVGEGFLYLTILMLVPVLSAVITAKLINIIMIRLTNTNAVLIRDIESGYYQGELSTEEQVRVLKLLKKGKVATIKGGLSRLKFTDFFYNILIVLGSLSGRLFFLLYKAMPTITYHGSQWNTEQSKLHEREKQLKSDADDNAEQKRKQADFSKEKYEKQAAYNIKYSDKERHQAIRDQREYQKAKRDADLL